MLDCKDLGGENCRMTIWVELENVVYGNYAKEAEQMGKILGLQVF
ncbi:MAG: hypothetical protein QMD20_02755 [Candidatus Bathyarchaeia archaeon]|nr:hypothetical protein [Candidatus Bathyarchaeia archaeon]